MPMSNYSQYNSGPKSAGNYPSRGNYNRPTGGGNTAAQGFNRNANTDSQTEGVMMSNEKMGKFLRTRYWNRFLTIEIGTYQPGTPLDYNTVRNAQVFSAVCSFSTMFALRNIMEEVMESLKQTNTFESVAIEGNQKKDVIIEISNGSNINQPMGLYLVIYKNVDAGKRTNTFEVYPFTALKVMRGYDHNTGASKDDIKAVGEFKKFYTIVNEGCKAFTMAQAHAVKEATKMDRMAGINALTAISASMGIDQMKSVTAATTGGARTTGQSSYSRGGYSGGNNGTGPNPNNYHRTSQGGQWNRNGQYGNAGGNRNSYQQTQNNMNSASSSSPSDNVDVTLSAATLQQVTLDDFT